MIKDLPGNDHSVMNSVSKYNKFRKLFFVVMACAFCIIAVAGFAPSYRGAYNGVYQFHWFVHVHGAFMAAWLVLFMIQTILVKTGNLRLHRQLGVYSVALGILVWVSMGVVSYRVIIGYPPHIHSISEIMWGALWVQLSAMNLFGLFFAWGVYARKNAAAHKRLLYLAMLVLLQAAVGRMSWLPWYNMDNPNVFFIYLDLLLIPLILYDLTTIFRIHKITVIGCVSIIAAQLIATML